ncbi:hypothetical protein [Pseudoalteromonas sp. T1lg48]|uniref:hypothetical protein n=1 Tax=Pseudoalteromonas sp. T1lg48 TaxID=2077100 RepID=UPI000CF6798F|nr:hypothetical protein [Pseudoalteromonas sp. T1lg48]
MHKCLLGVLVIFYLTGCDLRVPGADEQFGQQNFVSAVALIELHKVRHGRYPTTLNELEFLGDWDGIWLGAVRYERYADGYNLYVERGWVGTPDLAFSSRFKQGLGIRKTNVRWLEDVTVGVDGQE